ncbi:MAG: hypothetical protein PF961_23240 [Planctomycetota bacterium]|nr:hypothetical protein [Planctomycetota bacterium]
MAELIGKLPPASQLTLNGEGWYIPHGQANLLVVRPDPNASRKWGVLRPSLRSPSKQLWLGGPPALLQWLLPDLDATDIHTTCPLDPDDPLELVAQLVTSYQGGDIALVIGHAWSGHHAAEDRMYRAISAIAALAHQLRVRLVVCAPFKLPDAHMRAMLSACREHNITCLLGTAASAGTLRYPLDHIPDGFRERALEALQ